MEENIKTKDVLINEELGLLVTQKGRWYCLYKNGELLVSNISLDEASNLFFSEVKKNRKQSMTRKQALFEVKFLIEG